MKVLLLSGGLDSVSALCLEGADTCVFVDYGQSHCEPERHAARAAARAYNVDLVEMVVRAPLGGALMGQRSDPRCNPAFLPGRNGILLHLAAAFGTSAGKGPTEIVVGFTLEDCDGFPDTRPAYVEAMSTVLSLGTNQAVHVRAPFHSMTKAEVVAKMRAKGKEAELMRTWSCYHPTLEGKTCGQCTTCFLRESALR